MSKKSVSEKEALTEEEGEYAGDDEVAANADDDGAVDDEQSEDGDEEAQGADDDDDEDGDGIYEDDAAVSRYRMPDKIKGEMFGIADQLLGASKIIVMCEDGKSRMGRIRGKMKRRMWIRTGDLLIIKPWEFQNEKADIMFRYFRTQSINMSRRKLIPELLDHDWE